MWYLVNLVEYKISTLYLKTFKFFQLKPIDRNKINYLKSKKDYLSFRSIPLRIFKNILK